MAVTSSSEPKSDTPVEPWRAELEEQIAVDESWGEQQSSEAAAILLNMFLAYPEDGEVASLKASLAIAADYWAKYLPSSHDPLNKPYMMEDKGLPGYLARFYELVFYQSWLLRYDDPRQDLLVRLLVDLRNLPKVTYKSVGKEYHAYHNDPIFGMMCEDNWNGKFASERPEPEDPKAKAEFISICDEWVNFSSFQARYHGARVYDPWDTYLKYPSVDISLGLEEELPGGKLGECRLLVVSQWLTHAGEVIHEDMEKLNKDVWGIAKWKQWARKIKEILDAGGRSEEVTSNLQKALDNMISVRPDSLEEKKD